MRTCRVSRVSVPLAVAAIAAAFFGGCRGGYQVEPIIDVTTAAALPFDKSDLLRLRRRPQQVLNPYTYNPMLIPAHLRTADAKIPAPGENFHDSLALETDAAAFRTRPYYDIANDPAVPVEFRKEARNRLIEALIAASDHNAGVHMAGMKATQAAINLALGATAIGLTGGASVATTLVAQSLAAAATGVQGVQALIDKEIYSEALAESIVTLVNAKREEMANRIRSHYGDDLLIFPVERGLAMANEYNESASLYNALALARQAIEASAIRTRQEVRAGHAVTSISDQLGRAEDELRRYEGDLERARADKKAAEDRKAALEAKNTAVPKTIAAAEQRELEKVLPGRIAQAADAVSRLEALVKSQRSVVATLGSAVAELIKNRTKTE